MTERPDIDAIRFVANRTAELTSESPGPAHADAAHLLVLCDYIEQLEAEIASADALKANRDSCGDG